MDLNLDSIVGKIEHNADKLGLGIGAYSELNRFAKAWAQYGIKDPIDAAINILNALLATPHIPNLKHMSEALFSVDGTFRPAVMAAVIGYFLKEVDVMPQLTRLGNGLMKAGVGAAEAAAVIDLLVYSGSANSPITVAGTPHSDTVPMGPRSISLASSYKEIRLGGAF